MTTNADRFPSATFRLTYVAGRLNGRACELILPKICYGIPQFEDFQILLKYLETAFGDPDRVHNAQNKLYRLKQRQLDFSEFFAEFHRLDMEGEVPETALPPLLHQAISREIQDMLVHIPATSRDFWPFVRHLQELDNRYRQHQQQINRQKVSAPVKETRLGPRPSTPTSYSAVVQTAVPKDPDAMDLTRQKRSPVSTGFTRKERGECFRCGSKDHRVRDCPRPDTRPLQFRHQPQSRSPSPKKGASTVTSLPRGRPAEQTVSPSDSVSLNGVSLRPVAHRL